MSEPTGLPPVDGAGLSDTRSAIDKNRICPDCKGEARVYSNSTGVNATCGPCKKTWPIAMTPMSQPIPHMPPRGLHKQVLVEPDWDKAYDEIGESTDENVRRPKKR